jgi:hypothetical protein
MNTKNKYIKALLFGILVNIKPYFLILVLEYTHLDKMQYKFILTIILSSVVIFIMSSLLVGLNIFDFFKSYIDFGKPGVISRDGIYAFPNTIAQISILKNEILKINNTQIPLIKYNIYFNLLPLLSKLTILLAIFAVIAGRYNNNIRTVLIFAIIANFSYTTGGYIYIIYLISIPILIKSPKNKFGLILMLILSMD